MKTRYKIIACLAVIICFCNSSIKAQDDVGICLTSETATDFHSQFIQARANNNLNVTLADKIQVRIFFHIVTNNDGTRPGANPADIPKVFDSIRHDYAPGNICFVNAGFDYVASDMLNHINVDSFPNPENLFKPYFIPGCLNIFYLDKINGTNESSGNGIGGKGFGVPSTGCMIGHSKVLSHTSSHEGGHCFGLYHTFSSQFGEEFINGTACDVRGDAMCETNADPYSHKLDVHPCYSDTIINGVKIYDGFCQDPAGVKTFDPPYDNMMSYWKRPQPVFTSDQFIEMKYAIKNYADLTLTASQDNIVMTAGQYSSGYIYRSAINSFTTTGDLELTGSVKAGFFGGSVTLKNGFHASPASGSVTIAATECNGNNSGIIAKKPPVHEISSADNAVADNFNNGLIIYPNPSAGNFRIQYKQPTVFDAVINVRNTNGALLFTATKKSILNLQENVNLMGKAKGIYFIEVSINGKRLTAKAVVQ